MAARYWAAVIGHPIEYSLSPLLHNAGYQALGLDDYVYERADVTEASWGDFVDSISSHSGTLVGLSCTMPCKKAALGFADTASEKARLIGAANTLVPVDGGWRADNTDGDGLLAALDAVDCHDLSRGSGTAAVIGAGSTARTAVWALAQRGARSIRLINRTDRTAEFRDLSEALNVTIDYVDVTGDGSAAIDGAQVTISTVPSVVLSGREAEFAGSPLVDVSYDPYPSPIVTHARSKGFPAVCGDVMLHGQALEQFRQFTGQQAPAETMRVALDHELSRRTQR